MSLEAQKRNKNNIVHVFDGQKTVRRVFGEVEVSVCGSCSELRTTDATYQVDAQEVIDEDYLIVDGDIIGKFCDNCARSLR